MRTLVAHPSAFPPPGIAATAGVELAASGTLRFTFRLDGALALVRVPARARAERVGRLWERTCFEAFIGPAAAEHYVEFNFSPSTEWAAYAFDGYRRGMRPLELAAPPVVAVQHAADALVVTASVDFAALEPAPWPWRVGLTAVVASAAGQVSHFALAHSGPQPDFHDAAGWLLVVEGMTR